VWWKRKKQKAQLVGCAFQVNQYYFKFINFGVIPGQLRRAWIWSGVNGLGVEVT